MLKKTLKKILNQPVIWNSIQYFVGANQWKLAVYPSVLSNQGDKLLDFGCSIGNITPAFLNFDYYGIDLDPEAIAAARARFRDEQRVKFYALDILTTRLPVADFDQIIFGTTGHHLTDQELRLIIETLLSYLKPGGSLHFFDIFRQPNKDGLTTRLLTKNDQGKFVRTLDQYENFFSTGNYTIAGKRIFESPKDRLVRLQDMLYICLKPNIDSLIKK